MHEVSAPSDLMNLNQELFLEVVKQLEKDFALSGISIDLPNNVQPSTMWKNVLKTLNELLKNDPELLRNLLYRIDLNENKVQTIVLENKEKDFLHILAQQLILREIQKVLNRLKHRLD
jgi:hypothetical protein